ncbi:hypothetical protein D3C73_1174220 [compost metagenome]
MLARLTCGVPWLRSSRPCTALRMNSAACCTISMLPRRRIRQNSSPPRRQARSCSPAIERRMLPMLCSTRSPAWWPWRSLICLKRSQSISSNACGGPSSCVWHSCRYRARPRRLCRPVSSSVRTSSRVCVSWWVVMYRLSSAASRSWLRRRSWLIRACSLVSTRRIVRRRK